MTVDPASLIVAISTAVATYAGIRTATRGRDDAQRQAEAAERIDQREQAWNELRETVENFRTDLDRERARRVSAEAHTDDLLTAIAEHEVWDADRRREQPQIPAPPRLRVPRPRASPEN